MGATLPPHLHRASTGSQGVKCVIHCGAHRFEHAGFLRLGTGIARQGWLTKDDVINTLPLKALKEELAR